MLGRENFAGSLSRTTAFLVFCFAIAGYLAIDPGSWVIKALSLGAAGVLVFIAAKINYSKAATSGAEVWWGLITIAVVVLLPFVWAANYDSVQNSDFGVYWHCGQQSSWDLSVWVDHCQSRFLHPNLIYWSRSLFYTGLLSSLGLGSYVDLKFANAGFHVVALVIWFLGLRRVYDQRTALCATLLLAVFPEFWFTTTLATTDNAAMMFVVSFLVLLPRLVTGRLVVLVPILAVTMFVANALRTIGPLMLLATIFWALAAADRRQMKRAISGVMLVALIYVILGAVWAHLVRGTVASDPLQLFKALSSIDFHTTQDFASNYPWGEYFWFAVPPADRLEVAAVRIWQELVNGFSSFPQYLMVKAYTLFSGTGYYGLASYDYTGFNPDTVYVVPKSNIPFHGEWFPWLGVAGFTYVWLAMKGAISFRSDGLRRAILSWMAAFFVAVLFLGETQPRYVLLIAPSVCLLAAQGIFPPAPDGRRPDSLSRLFRSGALLLGLFGFLCLLFWGVRSVQPNLNRSASLVSQSAPGLICEGARAVNSYKNLRIRMPVGVDCAVIAVPRLRNATSLSFFVSGIAFPYLWEPKQDAALRYEVLVAGQSIFSGALNGEPVRWQRVEFGAAAEGAPEILIRLYRNESTRDGTFDVSWLREK